MLFMYCCTYYITRKRNPQPAVLAFLGGIRWIPCNITGTCDTTVVNSKITPRQTNFEAVIFSTLERRRVQDR